MFLIIKVSIVEINEEIVKDKKWGISIHTGYAPFRWFRNELQKLPTTSPRKNRSNIGHHCGCNDEQLDRDLHHSITSLRNRLLGRERGKTNYTKRGARWVPIGLGNISSWPYG